MKLGFIGFGNMAQAIVQGLVTVGNIEPSDINVCAAHFEKCKNNAAKYGVRAYPSSKEVVQASDWIVLAVKPYQLQEVTKAIQEELSHKVVISIAAGFPYAKVDSLLKEGTHHLSTIPNTPVAIGEGIFVVESTHSLSNEEFAQFEDLFGKIGMIQLIDTEHLSIAGTIAGCAPAYTEMYLEALGDAGVKHGLKRDEAYTLAACMIKGTGALYLSTRQHPGQMKDAVCSPAGTTIKGVASLEKNAFRGIVIEAIDEVEKKDPH